MFLSILLSILTAHASRKEHSGYIDAQAQATGNLGIQKAIQWHNISYRWRRLSQMLGCYLLYKAKMFFP